jgi:hypothetical protein
MTLFRSASEADRRALLEHMALTVSLIEEWEALPYATRRRPFARMIDLRLRHEAMELERLGYRRVAARVRAAIASVEPDPPDDKPPRHVAFRMLAPKRWIRTPAVGA